MAIYILKTKTSDLSGGADFNREISADAETAGSITVSVANGAVETSRGYTKPYKPSNADWETGSITVKVNVTTANSNMWLSIQAHRINKDGTIQESNQATGEQQLSTTGVKTFTMNSFNWSAGACDDRIRIDYIFRSANAHGGAISVVIETGTTNTEITTSITENAGTCRATFVKNLRQYKPDHKTIIAEGGTTNGDGVSNNIYLDSLIASRDNADKLTHKIEVEPVGTAFDNAANRTARQILYDPSSPKIRRSHSLVYDSVNKRYLLFGGWNGTTRYNDVWELSADDRFGSSPPQWRKLNPTGTPPSARTTHLAFFDAVGNRMIIHGGYDGSDKNDTYALDITTRYSEAWSTLSPTGTAPTARSQAAGAFKASTRKAYIHGGLVGAGDYRNDLFELDLSTTNGAWTQLKAEDASGNPPSRADHSMVFDSENNRLIIFGGYNGTVRLNDLWQWAVAGAAFTEVIDEIDSSSLTLIPRQMHVAVYDSDKKRMVVWGGRGSTNTADYYDELWEFDAGLDGVTYFFDASDAAPIDAQGVWTDDANAFDGLLTTFAFGFTTGTATNNNIFAEGTNAPASGSVIRAVRARIYVGGNVTAAGWGAWIVLTEPTDGWTWDKVQALETSIFYPSGGDPQAHARIWTNGKGQELGTCARVIGATNTTLRVYRIEIEVNPPRWINSSKTLGDRQSGARSAAACYDSDNKMMVIMGGEDASLEENKHISLVDLTTAIGSAKMYGAMLNNWLWGRDAGGYAYNPDRDETLIFGGFGRLIEDTIAEGEHLNEFWIYSYADNEWYQPILNTIFGLSEREGVAVVYDTLRDRYLIHGGLTGNNTTNNTFFNDVWELKASAVGALGAYTLTKLSPTGTKPAARWLHAAVYDSVNDRMVIFGGDDGSGFRNDIWGLSFSGGADGAWAQITPTGTAPSARRQCAYAYDPNSNFMLITHGATGVSSFVSDSFLVSLVSGSEAWGGISPSGTAPTARRGMTAVYRSTDDKFYCFGGRDVNSNFNNLFTLTSTTVSPAWTTLSPTGSLPATRRSHFAGYSPTSDKMMIYGGRDEADATFNSRNDTWLYTIGTMWALQDPKIYIRGAVPVTGLAASTSYHWQSWVTGTSGGDADKVSAFGNSESVADFLTGAGQQFTQALNEIVAVVDSVPKQAQKAVNEVLLIVDSLVRSASRTFAEVIAIADAVSNQAQKVFSETVAIADSLIRQGQKILAEAISIFDTSLTQATLFKTLSEAISIADSLVKQATRSFNEAVAIADSMIVKVTAKIFEEAVAVADSIQRTASRTFSESVAIIDAKVLQTIKSFVETIVAADIFSIVLTIKKELSEVILFFDSALKTIGKFLSPEIVLVADSAARLSGKNLQDTIIALDSIAKENRRNILEIVLVADTSIRQGIKTFGEAVMLSDNFLRTWTIQRALEEVVTLVDILLQQTQKAFSEAVAVADAAVEKIISKVLSEIIAVTDTIGKQASRIFGEAVAVTDSIVRSAIKLLSEMTVIADTFVAVAVIKKEIVEAVLLADSAIKSVTKSMTTEIVLISDNVARLAEKNLQDAVIVADSIVKETHRIILESLLLTDTLIRQGVKTFVEAVAVVDSFLRTWTLQRVFQEIIAIADSITKQAQRAFIEALIIVDSMLKTPSKVLSDVVAVADFIEKQTIRIFSEAAAIVDSLARQITASRTFTEVVAIADSVLKQTGRTFAEVVAVTDSIIRSSQKVLNEALIIADAVSKEAQRAFIEAVLVADALARQSIKALSESLIIADTLQALKVFIRDLAEVVAVLDSITKQVGRSLAEAVLLADSAMHSSGKLASEAITVAGSFVHQTVRTISEAVAIADNLVRQSGKILSDAVAIADPFASKVTAKILVEAIVIADTIEKLTGRILSEIVAITDNLIRQTSKVLSDALTVIDTFSGTISIQKILAEAVAIADSVAKKVERTFAEIISLGDFLTRTPVKVLSDALTLIDSTIRQTARALAEAVIIADTISNQVRKTFMEAVAIIDSLNRQVARAFAETVLIADSVMKIIQRMIQEIVSVTGALSRVVGKDLNDTVAVADSISREIVKIINEAVAIIDSVLKQGARFFEEAVSIADSSFRQAGKALADAVAIADSVTASKLQKILSEIIVIADSVIMPFTKLLVETMSIADTAVRQTAKIFGEAVSITVSARKQILRVFSDAVAVADSMARLPTKLLNEIITVSDSAVRSMSRTLAQTIIIADSAMKKAIRLLAEALSIADSIAKLLTRYANLNEIVQMADSTIRAIGKAIAEAVRIAAGILNNPIFPPVIKVAIQFVTAKIGVLLSTSKQNTELKSAKKEVELKGAKQDINL